MVSPFVRQAARDLHGIAKVFAPGLPRTHSAAGLAFDGVNPRRAQVAKVICDVERPLCEAQVHAIVAPLRTAAPLMMAVARAGCGSVSAL